MVVVIRLCLASDATTCYSSCFNSVNTYWIVLSDAGVSQVWAWEWEDWSHLAAWDWAAWEWGDWEWVA